MRTISVLALVAWAVVVPGVLRAGELTFAIDGAGEYDTNVFRSSEDEKDDYIFRFTPSAQPRRTLSTSSSSASPVTAPGMATARC